MVTMTEEQIDDILFYARTGQTEEFQTLIKEFSRSTNSTPAEIIAASVEEQSQNTSLHMAAANCQLDILNHIIGLISMTPTQSKSSHLDAQNAWGNTPLHWASLNGHLEAVKALLAAGAKTDMKNKAGHDAIYEAEINSKDSVVEWLLQQDRGLDSRPGEAEDLVRSTNGEQETEMQRCESELIAKTKDIALESST